jgi:uncharacterized protein (DUF736 family)
MTKDMSGALFPAREKKSENSPDYTGDVTIGGVKYRLSGWRKESAKGVKYMSLAVREGREVNRPIQQPAPYDDSSEIPFAPEIR